MKTRLAMKLGAVAVALLVNGLILGGAAYIVNAHGQDQSGDSPVACKQQAKAVHLTV